MKRTFYEYKKRSNTNVKINFLMGLSGENNDVILNTLLCINLISTYPSLDFKIYNCNLNSNSVMFAIKDKYIYTSIFSTDGECLFATTSKDKKLITELYYSMQHILNSKGKYIFDKKTPSLMIEDQTYMQYIMNNDLRCLLGSINEFFMPEDLFLEIAERLFGDNEKIMNELKKINVFLHNMTYKSKLKVLLYESELRKYMSSGQIPFL